MKKILFLLICLTSVVGLFAQPNKNVRAKERIAAQRVGFITQRLDLTPEESQQFWPIYNQYTEKLQEVRKAPKLEKPLDEMSDAETEKLIMSQMDRETKELELRKEYYQKFKTIISVKKIAKLYKAERDFRAELLKQLQEMKQMKKEARRE
jgi:hypothetical protein